MLGQTRYLGAEGHGNPAADGSTGCLHGGLLCEGHVDSVIGATATRAWLRVNEVTLASRGSTSNRGMNPVPFFESQIQDGHAGASS